MAMEGLVVKKSRCVVSVGKGNTNAKLHKVGFECSWHSFKERDKTINNLCMLSFSSIFDNIKVLMRSLTAAKRN